jgi:hypothetical protein
MVPQAYLLCHFCCFYCCCCCYCHHHHHLTCCYGCTKAICYVLCLETVICHDLCSKGIYIVIIYHMIRNALHSLVICCLCCVCWELCPIMVCAGSCVRLRCVLGVVSDCVVCWDLCLIVSCAGSCVRLRHVLGVV